MSVRRTVAGALSGALVASALLATQAPAAHAADPDDTTFTPVAADLIGVGSDTSQHAVWSLANAWNAQSPVPAFKVATFAATGGGTITLPTTGAVTRPNGSGSGKNLLHGGTNNVDVDFARSSSTLNAGEISDGLQQFPFALDEMVMVVSNSTPSNAPASLTPAQIVGIYKGEITNWSQIDATKSGVIAPKIPQSGSGTYAFFVAQLKAMNGGADVALAGSVASVQEHDDTAVKNDPNAIAPFSVGRAELLGETLRTESGWSAKRALYNVVRGVDVTDPEVQAVFGPTGFFCSDAARSLIRDAGFGQLDSEEDGGVCGLQTTSPTSNFQLNGHDDTPTAVGTTVNTAATSPGARKVTLKATVAPNTAAGTITFRDGATVVATGVAVVNGVATRALTSVKPGTHRYAAQFVPANAEAFTGSTDPTPASVLVRTTAAISESFPSAVARGARARGTITVALAGTTTKATGTVVVKLGTKVIGKGTLRSGKVTLTLARLTKGKKKLVVTWGGDTLAPRTSKVFYVTQR